MRTHPYLTSDFVGCHFNFLTFVQDNPVPLEPVIQLRAVPEIVVARQHYIVVRDETIGVDIDSESDYTLGSSDFGR